VSAFLPVGTSGHDPDGEHPHLLQRDLRREERRARWAVRAAQWRAREIAQHVFGGGVEARPAGPVPTSGPVRGMLRLRVPFDHPDGHRDRESRFMAAAYRDPVLSQVALVYVFDPADG